MIVMLNGAFGVGKTTLANALLERRPGWRHFDPENVGFLLRRLPKALSKPEERTGDFQDLRAWAPTVVRAARAAAFPRRTLVVPMTLVDPRNYEVIRRGFERIGPTYHFALVATAETIAERLIERGDEPGSWPHQQIQRCVSALNAPEFAVHLDAYAAVNQLVDHVLAEVEKDHGG